MWHIWYSEYQIMKILCIYKKKMEYLYWQPVLFPFCLFYSFYETKNKKIKKKQLNWEVCDDSWLKLWTVANQGGLPYKRGQGSNLVKDGENDPLNGPILKQWSWQMMRRHL